MTAFARRWIRTCALAFAVALAPAAAPGPGAAARAADAPGTAGATSATPGEAPLIVGNRTLHVFRAAMGAFSAAERAEGARQRILRAFDEAGEGWTSVRPTELGVLVELDGKPMFTVAPGDARELANESAGELANRASRVLQKAWAEAQERRDPKSAMRAAGRVALAAFALVAGLVVTVLAARWLRRAVADGLERRFAGLPQEKMSARILALLPGFASRLCVLIAWLASLAGIFAFLVYALAQFVVTRPAAETLLQSLEGMGVQALGAAAGAVPGLFVAIAIFLVAWMVTQATAAVFNGIAAGHYRLGMLDAHTVPATRRIVNATLWLFAVAMAYPYLPGAQTEAFKGLSVLLGIMVSIGASGLVGQIASGVILAYTRSLKVGDYVRIQDFEGTVTRLELFVTRLRTGMGEEISMPNTVVLANVTRNFSRVAEGQGFVLDTTVTIGYDTPWRQVHALLLQAAQAVPGIMRDPAPFVMQTALSDFYVAYKLVAHVDSEQPRARARVASDLYASIQDEFNRHGVQIMSPHYLQDPAAPKVVAPAQWYAAPAGPPPKP